ncbi:MAG: hypothetical protein IPM45_01245 [Acidimicrobiales bacterium]|nr:hypothetical protein [Acidimicrobiales bacterium]
MSDTTTRITRDDIEAKLRAVRGEVTDIEEETKNGVIIAGIVVVVAVVVGAYLFGRRKGRRSRAIVEIRRV